MTLNDVCYYVKEKRSTKDINAYNYVTTDNMLPNKSGITSSEYLPAGKTVDSFKKGDVLLSNIRPYFKKIWLADKDGGCCADVLILRPKNISSELLYAYLSQDAFFEYDTKGAKGSKMPRGDKDHIMKFPLKELKNGRDVGKIIKDIDDKIALNNKKNTELENIAKTVYDYWFTQFDFHDKNGNPYKSSGGKMYYNEILKREIPEGWEVVNLSNIAEIFNGSTPSTKEEDNYGGNIVWITPKDLSDQQRKFIWYGDRNITEKGYHDCNTTLVPKGTILLSSRAPIGLVSIAACELCTNQGFKNIVPKNSSFSNYIYYVIKTNIPKIEKLGSGTTFKEVSKNSMESFELVIPPIEIIQIFNSHVDSIFNEQLQLLKETDELTKIRDYLLPLLMNGQINF